MRPDLAPSDAAASASGTRGCRGSRGFANIHALREEAGPEKSARDAVAA